MISCFDCSSTSAANRLVQNHADCCEVCPWIAQQLLWQVQQTTDAPESTYAQINTTFPKPVPNFGCCNTRAASFLWFQMNSIWHMLWRDAACPANKTTDCADVLQRCSLATSCSHVQVSDTAPEHAHSVWLMSPCTSFTKYLWVNNAEEKNESTHISGRKLPSPWRLLVAQLHHTQQTSYTLPRGILSHYGNHYCTIPSQNSKDAITFDQTAIDVPVYNRPHCRSPMYSWDDRDGLQECTLPSATP